MNYLPDSEPSPPPGDRHSQQVGNVLHAPTSHFPHVSSASNGSFPPAVDTFSGTNHRPTLVGRLPDGYQSSSSHSTPAGSDLKSPQSVRTTATPDYGANMTSLKRTNSDERYFTDASGGYDSASMVRNVSISTYNSVQRQTSSGSFTSGQPQKGIFSDPRLQRPNSTTSPSNYRPGSTSGYHGPPSQNGLSYSQAQNNFTDSYGPQQNLPPFNLPPPVYPSVPQNSSQSQQVNFPGGSNHLTSVDTNMDAYGSNGMGNNYVDSNGNFSSMSTFDGDGYSRSPFAMADDFTAWLFNEPNLHSTSPGADRQGSMSVGTSAFVDDYAIMPNGQYGVAGDATNGQMVGSLPQQHPMAVNSILDPASMHADLSENKRKDLIDFIEMNFTDHAFKDQKDRLMAGDFDLDSHPLSLRSLQTYIGSYWYHFHPQMPILHKPTFSSDKEQILLLFAVIAIGASCLDKIHGHDVTEAGSHLSSFLAWHLRGEIFKDRDFLPPAKLWVFQTLLLLETYEKMYSDRKLHERAHIHHGTTLTLMRRGSSLIGRSALDSPPMVKDEKTGLMTAANPAASASVNPEEWWNHWVTNEATRRVAFAAFIIDSIHATMFGHSATMVAHEMKLALPCDESLWSATSSAEVARIENKLQAQGSKSMTFFEGLKDTLKGKPVRTNSFGRTAIMAGLLSVTWHMNQRDVQIHHLGALKALGGKDIWRGPLTKAFDSWKNDFDHTVGKENVSTSNPSGRLDEENIFESRTVLHHLAHMAMHVDVVSCQIFAKAERLLGRTTLPSDYEIAQKRIRQNWAPRASARHATFYALKFLRQVLMPDSSSAYRNGTSGSTTLFSPYSARDDFLLNRPWVLYYAVLIVWSYGYALDGVLQSPHPLDTAEAQHADMIDFLTRVGGIQDPRELERTRDRNACLGLLYVLHETFQKCRWELLHEAAKLLENCIKMLKGIA